MSDGVQPLPRGDGIELTPVAFYEFVMATPRLDVGSPLGSAANWEMTIGLYHLRVAATAGQNGSAPLRADRSGAD